VKIKSREIPRVLVDEEKIRLAVQNLIENAIHYTPQGGRVTASVSHDTKEVMLQVQDTGMGIPENQKARVFEKFFRASNAKTVDTEGSGLGLYLVNNIIQAHGGKVWFTSEEGKGSTFAFTLPVREEITEFLKKF
jgi:signal transduction histidine kinase